MIPRSLARALLVALITTLLLLTACATATAGGPQVGRVESGDVWIYVDNRGTPGFFSIHVSPYAHRVGRVAGFDDECIRLRHAHGTLVLMLSELGSGVKVFSEPFSADIRSWTLTLEPLNRISGYAPRMEPSASCAQRA